MTRYRTSPKCGITPTVTLGEAIDRAPRPYTAAELSELTSVPLNLVMGFLISNELAGYISRREISRDNPHREGGKPIREYWRGTGSVQATFSEGVDILDEKVGAKLTEGKRPVSWKDGTRAVWSIDETDTVSVMKGNTVTRLGRAEKVTAAKTGFSIRIRGGPELQFGKEGRE